MLRTVRMAMSSHVVREVVAARPGEVSVSEGVISNSGRRGLKDTEGNGPA
jgi:hypothetical protein